MAETLKVTVVVRSKLWTLRKTWEHAHSVGIQDGILVIGVNTWTTRCYPLDSVEYYEFSKVGK